MFSTYHFDIQSNLQLLFCYSGDLWKGLTHIFPLNVTPKDEVPAVVHDSH